MSARFQPLDDARSETLGAVTSTSLMTSCTSGAAVAGSWVSLGTTGFDYHHVVVLIGYHSAATDMLLDVGLDDGAGNTFVLIPSLKNNRRLARTMTVSVELPLYVPRGSLLKIRCTGSANTETLSAQVTGFSNGIGGAPGNARCHALYTPNTRRGATITPGNGSMGSWSDLIASTPGRVTTLAIALDLANDVTRGSNQYLWDLAFGASGSEQLLLRNVAMTGDSGLDLDAPYCYGAIGCDIPSGTRLAARAQMVGTVQPIGFAAWGCGP